MPNRADHTVNASQRDPLTRINAYALIVGSIAAGVAAVAVVLTGETLGIWTGAAVLTLLAFLQIFFWFPRIPLRKDAPVAVEAQSIAPATPNVFDNEPILVVSVSQHGRVRAFSGQRAYLPGLRPGVILDDLLRMQRTDLEAGLFVRRLQSVDGELVVLLPASADGGDVQDAVRERTNFFAGLGHDLKSPLNGIIGFADIMDAELRGPLPDAYQDYPTLIRESGETLLRLVEDLLGYAKAEAGTYELDPAELDIAASGESVLRQSKALAELSGVTLQMKTSGEVLALADAGAVRRIWDNLVSNAIKYSSKGDSITLSAFERGEASYISVRDTGAGMSAGDLARIAKPFAQGENAKGRSGTGLGLAMVQKLAELQGGLVKIETAPGQGTTVTVKLPGAARDEKRAAE